MAPRPLCYLIRRLGTSRGPSGWRASEGPRPPVPPAVPRWLLLYQVVRMLLLLSVLLLVQMHACLRRKAFADG